MKVKLQPPSATDLPGYNPILPPTAITQVMLIANPYKVRPSCCFMYKLFLDYSLHPFTFMCVEYFALLVTFLMFLSSFFQEKIRLKFKLTYNTNAGPQSDVGEADNFPVQ